MEKLPPAIGSVFCDATWLNFGDPAPDERAEGRWSKIASHAHHHGWHSVPFALARNLASRTRSEQSGSVGNVPRNFEPWYFQKGDRLDLADGSMTFIFSEHFFEHLFFDEAAALMRECARVLQSTGVVRTIVPDADLRKDLGPEPVGFPGKKVSWTEPAKHKTRWSVYMLSELLGSCGLEPVPLRYFDKKGDLTEIYSGSISDSYFRAGVKAPKVDLEIASRLDYIQRKSSLIVDGVKP